MELIFIMGLGTFVAYALVLALAYYSRKPTEEGVRHDFWKMWDVEPDKVSGNEVWLDDLHLLRYRNGWRKRVRCPRCGQMVWSSGFGLWKEDVLSQTTPEYHNCPGGNPATPPPAKRPAPAYRCQSCRNTFTTPRQPCPTCGGRVEKE